MFNIGSGEIALIAIVALLLLGPKRLPELARGIGKFMREFRRQTDEVRSVVEREFYRMDQDVQRETPQPHAPSPQLPAAEPPTIVPASPVPHGEEAALPPADDTRSQVLKGSPTGEPVEPAPAAAETPADHPEPGKS